MAGTSGGAIAALMLALALPREKRERAFGTLADFSQLLRSPDPLLANFGFDDGAALREVVRDVLRAGGLSDAATLADLRRLLRLEVVFVAHDMTCGRPVHLSATSTPHMSVADAVFASCCVPLLFAPLRLGRSLLCDGAFSECVPKVAEFDDATTLFVVVPQHTRVDNVATWYDFLSCFMLVSLAPQWERIDKILEGGRGGGGEREEKDEVEDEVEEGAGESGVKNEVEQNLLIPDQNLNGTSVCPPCFHTSVRPPRFHTSVRPPRFHTIVAAHPLVDDMPSIDFAMDVRRARQLSHLGYVAAADFLFPGLSRAVGATCVAIAKGFIRREGSVEGMERT